MPRLGLGRASAFLRSGNNAGFSGYVGTASHQIAFCWHLVKLFYHTFACVFHFGFDRVTIIMDEIPDPLNVSFTPVQRPWL